MKVSNENCEQTYAGAQYIHHDLIPSIQSFFINDSNLKESGLKDILGNLVDTYEKILWRNFICLYFILLYLFYSKDNTESI